MKKGQHIFGTVKVGERGQIVIPKEAREIFDINAGDTLLVLGDEEQGIAIVKADVMKELAVKILKGLGSFCLLYTSIRFFSWAGLWSYPAVRGNYGYLYGLFR